MKNPFKKSCAECGDNPVPHAFEWFDQTLAVVVTPLTHTITRLATHVHIHRLNEFLFGAFIFFMRMTLLARWSTEKREHFSFRSELIWAEAHKRGIPIEQLHFLGKGTEWLRARIHGKQIVFESLPTRDDADTIIDDKHFIKKTFAQNGIATPRGESVYTFAQAKRVFDTITKPAVVKPRRGSRGRHTNTHIYTHAELRNAYRSAKQLCFFVVVEEYLEGSVYRGTAVNGKLVGVLEGTRPYITGNGTNTIRTHITSLNATLPKESDAILITPKMESFLARQHYTPESVLPQGVRIPLSEKIGIRAGGNTKEHMPHVHQTLVTYLEKAAALTGRSVVGFDFIAEDVTKDLDTQRWGIIECNSLPFINLHDKPQEGPSIPVASYVWDLWNDTL